MRYIKDVYCKGKGCIECKTQEEANKIAELFKDVKKTSHPYANRFSVHEGDFALDCNGSQYSQLSWYRSNGYTIYQASEFLTNNINYEIY